MKHKKAEKPESQLWRVANCQELALSQVIVDFFVVNFVFVSAATELFSNNGLSQYVDPSNYEDPMEAVKTFAAEVDRSQVKLDCAVGGGVWYLELFLSSNNKIIIIIYFLLQMIFLTSLLMLIKIYPC